VNGDIGHGICSRARTASEGSLARKTGVIAQKLKGPIQHRRMEKVLIAAMEDAIGSFAQWQG
jgi:hypothetical protein